MQQAKRTSPGAVLAAVLLLAVQPSCAQSPTAAPELTTGSTGFDARLESYERARASYESEASAYWDAISEKRRGRIAKRRSNQPVTLDDYVLTQPPRYTGPPRPVDPGAPTPPIEPRAPIPTVSDFLRAAKAHYRFVPQLPDSEFAFKRAYAKAATAAGLTRDQIVGIYVFETGGNGTFDMQAGLMPGRSGGKPISPAVGYNQLLSTNTVGLLAEYGDSLLSSLQRRAASLQGHSRQMMDAKIEALRRMVAMSRSVPYAWSEHDKLAKNTEHGMGLHAAVLDRDIGPILQVQKLANSVKFARTKGFPGSLPAAELELMNFTGDGNGFDMVTMPHAYRERVPTANFFQRQGYERNPIARRTGVVAKLMESIESKMERGVRAKGARELASAF